MSLPKKIFVFSSIALLVILLFWGIYNLSFKKSDPQAKEGGDSAQMETPEIKANDKQGELATISDEAVLSPSLSPDGQSIRYYSKDTGKAYQTDLDGTNKRSLSEKELPGLLDVSWSPDKMKVLTEFSGTNSRNRFFLYDYLKNSGSPLKDNLDSVIWGSDNKIFYKYYNQSTRERSLNISDPDGTNWFKITDIDTKNISIAPIPRTGLVSYWNSPDSFVSSNLLSVPVIGGEKKTLFSDKFGADYLWSSDGNRILVSHVENPGGNKMQLATINSSGGEYKNLGVPTFVSKCAWSKNNHSIYCALPGSIPDGSVLPNDYLSGKFNTADTFWRVDVTTGEKSRIIDLDKITAILDAENLFTNLDESILFFTNRIDGKLYRLSM